MNYIWRNLIAIDQLVNTLLNGEPDETLSSRAWRTESIKQPYWRWTRRFIDALFWFDPDHCANAYLAERARAQLPPEFRSKP